MTYQAALAGNKWAQEALQFGWRRRWPAAKIRAYAWLLAGLA